MSKTPGLCLLAQVRFMQLNPLGWPHAPLTVAMHTAEAAMTAHGAAKSRTEAQLTVTSPKTPNKTQGLP